ncbi:FMN-binding negative transcriptional regulator [Variovorax sp. J22P240]|uniref:FMN-binding negative transcriptional regulator n=1 Tax=Variovorax sp. J22P240 TaxID=3053514 RepID=UPI002578FA9B|nr:FMN-binding negative transcriptional regulator [Variovorax sp. J22P240]MDM0002625.1 FMN-binding negative transcriptional regulator [Variovorax sp. J22P240]
MYVSKHHQLTNREAVFALMESHPLGAWVCQARGALVANHVPFLLDRSRGAFGTLIGHVSRANGVWRELRSDASSLVMFQRPQAYITPRWYPGKKEHGMVVPTWNYAVAHAHGVARAVEERSWLLDMLNRLTDAHEVGQQAPWRLSDAPASYVDKLLGAIVGIEIPIERLEGKLKASQDEAMQDRRGTVAALQQSPREEERVMANLVMKAIDAEPPSEH